MTQVHNTPPARRRPDSARMGWDLTGRLTARLLQHYATHEPFKRGLAELYARHCAPRLDDISRARDLWQLEVPERTGEGL